MKKILAFCLSALLANIAFAENKTVYLTSLDWPPYSGKSLATGGASIDVAKAAFKAAGYNLVVNFYPWNRAVNLAKDKDSKYAGYFPEYYSESVAKEFSLSEPMGTSPLGFAERKADPKNWETVQDLEKYKVGVIKGYVNDGAEFDAAIAAKKIKTDAVGSDSKNLKKLANGRVDLAIIDTNVMNHLLQTDKSLKGEAAQLQVNKKLLVTNNLHIAFKKTPEGEKLTKIFNEGLKKIDVKAIMEKGMSQ